MTAEQAIKKHMLLEAISLNPDLIWPEEITEKNVDDVWEELLVEKDLHWDFMWEFRESGEDSGIPTQYSRHYECKEVARQLSDGNWVGWTYWYGGGKHANPEEIDWMDEAYFVDAKRVMKITHIFTKKGTTL